MPEPANESGGPVFASVNGGEDMKTRGIVLTGDSQMAVCSPVAARTTCYDTLLHTPISPIVDRFGLSIA
ncbi:hypothetical protein [Kitasatospora sp. NPDC089509]|uniref:hypothetical protein n=1 Tax=Kitasatospora sp. NPDC089509 TaxID=3364079 RepID=UPI0038055742